MSTACQSISIASTQNPSLDAGDVGALVYVSLLGSAASYGTFFYMASKGNLAKLSSLTFLTPVFASITGFALLDERFTTLQLAGASITLAGVLLMNKKSPKTDE